MPSNVLPIVIKRFSVIYFFQVWFFSMWKSDDSEIGPFPFRNWFYQGSNFPHDCFSITTQNNICTPIQFRQKLLRWAFAIRNLKSFSEAKRKSLAPFFQLEAQYHELPHRNFVIICILKTLISIISVKHFIVLTWTQKSHGFTFSLGLSAESMKSQRCLALLKDHIVSTGRLGDTKGTTKYYLAASTMKMSIFYLKWWLINQTDNASA